MRVAFSWKLVHIALLVLLLAVALHYSVAELRCRPVLCKQDITAPHSMDFLSFNCSVFDTNLLAQSIRFRVTDPAATITSIVYLFNGTWGDQPDTETGALKAMESLPPWTAASENLTFTLVEVIPDYLPPAISAGWFTFWDQAMKVVGRAQIAVEFTKVGETDTAGSGATTE